MMLVAPLGAASRAKTSHSIFGLFVWNRVRHRSMGRYYNYNAWSVRSIFGPGAGKRGPAVGGRKAIIRVHRRTGPAVPATEALKGKSSQALGMAGKTSACYLVVTSGSGRNRLR
jgi:hypothetical protein